MENNVIVVGTDHYNTLWLIRSLGMAGIKPLALILSATGKSFVVKSRYCSDFVIKQNNDEVISYLLSRDVAGKGVLFTTSDALAELLDINYDLLVDKYIIQNCCGEQGRLSYWMNKDRMVEKAVQSGLTAPKSYSLRTDIDNDLSEIEYPCLVKPELSAEASKENFRICNNSTELYQALQNVKANCSKVLVQEYVKPEYEYLIYGVSTDEEICLPGGLRKIHTCKSLKNLGMMSYSCLSSEIPSQLGNFDKIKDFVRAIGYKGLFSVEFMITKDKAYFLEINLRNDGTCYITTQAGVNMPAIWACCALALDSAKLPRTFKRERTYGMNEINYIKYTLNLKHLIRCLREISTVKAFSLIKLNDMKPVCYKIINALIK